MTPYNVYVLDLETTGLNGILGGDKILEIGIARVDLDLGKVYPERSMIINQELTEEQKKSWVFKNTDLTPEEIRNSPHTIDNAIEMLDFYLEGDYAPFTAYNASFDFESFLQYSPYCFKPARAPCLKEMAAIGFNAGRWMTAQEAYDLLCPDNPAQVPEGKEEHRALSDAMFEGWILLRMCEGKPEIPGRYRQCCEVSQ